MTSYNRMFSMQVWKNRNLTLRSVLSAGGGAGGGGGDDTFPRVQAKYYLGYLSPNWNRIRRHCILCLPSPLSTCITSFLSLVGLRNIQGLQILLKRQNWANNSIRYMFNTQHFYILSCKFVCVCVCVFTGSSVVKELTSQYLKLVIGWVTVSWSALSIGLDS